MQILRSLEPVRLSSVLWKGFIRRGKKNGLEFPRGVKGREGFLSTGTGVQSDQSFHFGEFWMGNTEKISRLGCFHTQIRQRESREMPQKWISWWHAVPMFPCQKLSMQIPVRLTLRPNKVVEGRSKRPSHGWWSERLLGPALAAIPRRSLRSDVVNRWCRLGWGRGICAMMPWV